MINKIQSRLGAKLSGKYKNTVAGIIFSILSIMGLQDVVAQTPISQDNLKKPNIELAKKDPVIEYMYIHIDDYYPEEKGYVDGLFDEFESQTRLDTALVFLGQIYKEVEKQKIDNKKKLQIVVCCFEGTLLGGQFYDRHEDEIDDPTFDYIIKFEKQYKEFLKRYFARVEGRMEELLLKIKQLDEQSKQLDEQSKQLDEQSKQLDEDIYKNFLELETTLSGFTVSDVQKNESIRQMIIDTYNLSLEAKYSLSQYMLDLYKVATQK